MKAAKKISFRAKIRKTMLMTGIVLFLIMVLSNFFNYSTRISYNRVLDGYDTLHAYYEHVESASDYVKSYLSTDSEETLRQYHDMMEAAHRDAELLRSNTGLNESWRYDLLENMLVSFEQVVDNVLVLYQNSNGSGEYRTNYDMFIVSGDLIADTSSDYYSLITASMSDHRDTMEMLQNLTWISFIIAFVLVIFWFIYYDRSVNHMLGRPLEEILRNIEQIRQGKYDLKDISSSSLEITQLCEALEDMAHSVSQNIETMQERDRLEKLLLEQENENLKKDELLAQSELKMLQNQINPHFLFNALNTISGLCLTDPDRACKTILVLAAYFRQTLTINDPFVTLEQEVSNVDNYLMLTEARFEGELHVECSLPDDLTKLRLPPLILQPIVENAVRHGFVSVDDRRVDICIRQDDERAYIRVSDRGHGFPPEVLRKLEDPNDPTYTGLYNVRKRLRSIYGEQCVFTIDSSEHGSTVAFSIPLISPQMPDIV